MIFNFVNMSRPFGRCCLLIIFNFVNLPVPLEGVVFPSSLLVPLEGAVFPSSSILLSCPVPLRAAWSSHHLQLCEFVRPFRGCDLPIISSCPFEGRGHNLLIFDLFPPIGGRDIPVIFNFVNSSRLF
ncbi:uncharacterized protein G2W53_013979 [Senna tora]|uniref:Uncharacterized protein n=1 Tax=Senna tora TaxID=362788 RepID=A0A834U2A3_9FABA|nr:uncharacterized protein G2W53_013979 [Senna tora]